MIAVRPAAERGHADHGWLDARHTFSFADYYDAEHMGFRSLRVMNDDRIAPGKGFGSHPHRDMEILTYVMEGSLQHRDNLGSGSVIEAGGFQRMTAGSGVVHSEFNPSESEPVHLYQVWIHPRERGLPPSYEELRLDGAPSDRLVLAASPDGRDGSLTIQQDAEVWLGRLEAGVRTDHQIGPGRGVWLQVLEGEAKLSVPGAEAQGVSTGDGVALVGEPSLTIESEGAEVLLFDLS